MRAATVAVLAAAIALIAACSATPAAASLLHPANTGHLNRRTRPKAAAATAGFSPVGNATLQWQFNASWLAGKVVHDVKRSTLEPDTVLAYVPVSAEGNTTGGYVLALNATTGKQLWLAQFTGANAPLTCIDIIETPTTVACLGLTRFGVVARYTGAVVASGEYAAGYQVGSASFSGAGVYTASHGQHVALTMLRVSDFAVGQAMVLDAVTGALTSMGTVTAPENQQLLQAWGGSLRETSAGGLLEWTVVFFMQNYLLPATSCNGVFSATFSSSGNASIVAQMPPSFVNSATATDCPNVQVAAYPDLDVVLAVTYPPSDVVQAYYLNGTKRFVIQQPIGGSLVRLAPGFSVGGSATDGIIVSSGCNLTSINALNETNWQVHNCSVLFGNNIVDVSGESIVVRGQSNGFAANLSAVSGATQWFAKLAGINNWDGGYFRTQVTASADVFACAPTYSLVRKADGATLASFDASTLWQDSAFRMDFQETPGAAAGAGTLLLAGLSGNIVSIAVTPQQ